MGFEEHVDTAVILYIEKCDPEKISYGDLVLRLDRERSGITCIR